MAQILHATLNQPSRDSGIPPNESGGRAFGYKRPFPSANAAVSQADNALGRNRYSPTARETREIWPYISGTRISVDPNTEGCRTSDTRRNIETQLLYINRLSDGDPVAK